MVFVIFLCANNLEINEYLNATKKKSNGLHKQFFNLDRSLQVPLQQSDTVCIAIERLIRLLLHQIVFSKSLVKKIQAFIYKVTSNITTVVEELTIIFNTFKGCLKLINSSSSKITLYKRRGFGSQAQEVLYETYCCLKHLV